MNDAWLCCIVEVQICSIIDKRLGFRLRSFSRNGVNFSFFAAALIFFVTFLYQDKKVNSGNVIWERIRAYYT